MKRYDCTTIALACASFLFLTGNAYSASTLQPSADGTAYDTVTGLTWKRCQEGQTWSGTTCTGTAVTYTFDAANALTGKVTFAGQSDWRMPTIRELLTIVDETASNPALNITVFQGAPASTVWSGSLFSNLSMGAGWIVDFSSGSSGGGVLYYDYVHNSPTRIGSSYGVRLVRGGQSSALLNLVRSDTNYVDNGDGTVTDTLTQLMWQRCQVGQSWNGTTCTGTASTMAWNAAKATTSAVAGKVDWRLPTRQELLSLVDYTKATAPVLNSTIFPNDLASIVWSGSPNISDSGNVWAVDFEGGYSYSLSSDKNNGVRLVRNTQTTVTQPSVLSDIECFLNWAEARNPGFLTPHMETQLAGTISYRGEYPNSGIYLGVMGDSVLGLGGVIGNTVTTIGKLSSFLPIARSASCK